MNVDSIANCGITLFARGDSTAISIPLSVHAFDGFRQWVLSDACPEQGRFTFLNGDLIVDMSPESIEEHNFAKTEITSVLYTRVKRLDLGRIFSDGCLYSNQVANISTEPDASFAAFATILSGRCHVRSASRVGVHQEIVGSPDWVLEVVSPSSRRKDKQLLRDGYFRAGVGEYWIVDALGEEIDFEMLVPGENGYVAVQQVDGWLASPTFGCSFCLTRKKAADGLWEYELGVRERT